MMLIIRLDFINQLGDESLNISQAGKGTAYKEKLFKDIGRKRNKPL